MFENEDPLLTFDSCKFNRKNVAELIIEPILSSAKESTNITINGPYGYGKTTFLKMLTNFLITKKYNVIFFNAWETDFISDPFLALYTEIFKDKESESDNKQFVKNLVKSTFFGSAKILTNLLPPLVGNVANSSIDGIRDILENETNEIINEYREIKKDIIEFRLFLKEKYSKEEKPLIFIIDELDRCKPTYSIALLERIKHIFNIEGIHFIFGIDKTQLSHAVKTLYGNGINSDGYLRRFFDIEYSLPQPQYGILLDQKFNNEEYDGFIMHRDFKAYISKLLSKLDFSIRDYEKMTLRLKLINNEQYYKKFSSVDTISIRMLLIILKMKKESLYNEIKGRQIASQAVLELIHLDNYNDMQLKYRNEINYFLKCYLDFDYSNNNTSVTSEGIKHPNYENKSVKDPNCRKEAHDTINDIFKSIEFVGKINI